MQLYRQMAKNTIFFHNIYNRLADNYIARAFSIINCSKHLAPPFCACISGVQDSKKMSFLLHYSVILIQFILLSDYIIFISRLQLFCKAINKVLDQGKIFTFFGQLHKISDGHFCGFANCYHSIFYHSFVALIVVLAVFQIKLINVYSIKKPY